MEWYKIATDVVVPILVPFIGVGVGWIGYLLKYHIRQMKSMDMKITAQTEANIEVDNGGKWNKAYQSSYARQLKEYATLFKD